MAEQRVSHWGIAMVSVEEWLHQMTFW